MEKIRVLIANHPRLMRDLVFATISDQPDMELVGEVAGDDNIENAMVACKPDFIIIFAEKLDERPAICSELLAHNPQARILALAPERNMGEFFWAVTDIKSMRVESSEEGILNALRGKPHCNESDAVVH